MEALENVIQATQLLQVNKKTLEDVDAICEVCSSLNTLQVRILTIYFSFYCNSITKDYVDCGSLNLRIIEQASELMVLVARRLSMSYSSDDCHQARN